MSPKKNTIKNVQDIFLINQFDELSKNSKNWHKKANNLFTSAGVIWKAMNSDETLYVQCSSIYVMLMGMSFEALLKGICIKNKNVEAEDVINHDLVKLSELAELTLKKTENKVLMLLSESVKWTGKYPTPKHAGQLQQYRNMVDSTEFDKFKLDGYDASISNNVLDFEQLGSWWGKFSDKFLEKTN